MRSMKVRQNESLTFNFNHVGAESVTFTVWDDDGIAIEETQDFTEGVAYFDIQSVLLDTGTYSYAFTLNYVNGNTNQLPDIKNCRGDCSFPEFIVCEGVPEES